MHVRRVLHTCMSGEYYLHACQESITYMHVRRVLHTCMSGEYYIHACQESITYMHVRRVLHTCMSGEYYIHACQESITYMHVRRVLHTCMSGEKGWNPLLLTNTQLRVTLLCSICGTLLAHSRATLCGCSEGLVRD